MGGQGESIVEKGLLSFDMLRFVIANDVEHLLLDLYPQLRRQSFDCGSQASKEKVQVVLGRMVFGKDVLRFGQDLQIGFQDGSVGLFPPNLDFLEGQITRSVL